MILEVVSKFSVFELMHMTGLENLFTYNCVQELYLNYTTLPSLLINYSVT
jgi:hypothetical protein